MYYILASHGEYAKACKASCEMITGAAPQFFVVTFTEDMTKESYMSTAGSRWYQGCAWECS